MVEASTVRQHALSHLSHRVKPESLSVESTVEYSMPLVRIELCDFKSYR
jgi:hypothetical protein